MADLQESPYHPDALRKRWDELNRMRDEIKGKADPLREERDKIVNAAREQELAYNAEIGKIEAGLYDIERERAVLAKALNGKLSVEAEPAEIGVAD